MKKSGIVILINTFSDKQDERCYWQSSTCRVNSVSNGMSTNSTMGTTSRAVTSYYSQSPYINS